MTKIKTLSKKDIKQINSDFNFNIVPKGLVQLIDDEFLSIDKNIMAFKIDEKLVPTLKGDTSKLKTVTIDMNAIPFLIKGADLMRPGIVDLGEFSKDDIVLIIDVNNKKGISIGKAIFDSEEIKTMEKGKVIKNIHYVGDKIWYKDF